MRAAELESILDSAEALRGKPKDVLDGTFPEQRAYIVDPAPLKASFCTRRAAKSYSAGLEFIADSYSHPRASYLFLAVVRAQAERDFWHDVLHDINAKYELGMEFNATKLIATMPNQARIYVGGADASSDEWRKMLGGKRRKVHIDEAQGFAHMDLGRLVYETFKPAVADHRGSIGLSGTPGLVAKGLFYDVTQGREAGWSLHKWNTFANTYMTAKWRAEIDQLKLLKPGVETTPWFRRNYLGEWVVEESALVYRYTSGRNDYEMLPKFRAGQWHYVLGCDLGYTDATAFTVCAYHDHDPCLYVIESSKETGLDVTAVAVRARALSAKYDFEAMVIDNANKQAVEEMVRRHDIPWIPADKTGKSDFIEIMNGEMLIGRVKFSPECQPLKDEYAALVWDDKATKRQEHAACENHCADSGLYAWRYCYQFLSQALKPVLAPGTQQWQEREADEMREQALRTVRIQQRAISGDWEPPPDDGRWSE